MLTAHEWYSAQPGNIKVLLFEYYVYKIRHKETEKENKIIKALAEFLKKTLVKLTRDTKVDHVNPLIDEKPEFASTKEELRRKALDIAIIAANKHEASHSSSYEEHSHGSSGRHHGKSTRKGGSRSHYHRSHHHHHHRGKGSSSPVAKSTKEQHR